MRYAENNTDRILGNVVRIGFVTAVDWTTALATVDFSGEKIEEVEWLKPRVGDDRVWFAPSVGEQVLCVSPSGDLSQCVIVGAIAQDDFEDVGDSANPKTVYADGTVVEYQKDSHLLLVDCSASNGTVQIICNQAQVKAQQITFDAPNSQFTGNVAVGGALAVSGTSTMSGNVTFTGGSVSHNGKNIGADHTHSGVKAGGDVSGGVA